MGGGKKHPRILFHVPAKKKQSKKKQTAGFDGKDETREIKPKKGTEAFYNQHHLTKALPLHWEQASSPPLRVTNTYRFGTFDGTVEIDSNGVPAPFPRDIPPIFGIPRPASPLPLLGRPAPPHDVSPPNPYPSGALSLLARLSFFPGPPPPPPRLPTPTPLPAPGDESVDPSPPELPSSFERRWRLVLMRPAGSLEPSSKRSIWTGPAPGDGGCGDAPRR